MPERAEGQPRIVRNVNTSSRVLEYLRAHSDVVIPYEEIARELGLKSRPHVVNAVGHLRNRGIAPIERPMRGTVIYHSGKVDYDLSENEEIMRLTPREGTQLEAALDSRPPEPIPPYINPAPVPKYFDYVGKMESYSIIRDNSDELYVAMPLKAFLLEN